MDDAAGEQQAIAMFKEETRMLGKSNEICDLCSNLRLSQSILGKINLQCGDKWKVIYIWYG